MWRPVWSWLIGVSAALLCGCAAGPARTPRAAAPQLAPGASGDAAQLIVLTVNNPVQRTVQDAASTPRGYESAGGPYFAAGAARRSEHALEGTFGLVERARWPIALLGIDCLVYRLPEGADREALVQRLRADPRVESVQPLQEFSTLTAPTFNDPYSHLQGNLEQLGIAEAQRVSRGEGVRVAIIDTGADFDHPDLANHISRREDFVGAEAGPFRADVHGTVVAGLIGAVTNNGIGIAGIAPEARLLLYRACWQERTGEAPAVCNSFTLAQALSAAIEDNAQIINLSLGGPSDPLLTRLTQQALQRGIIVVGAMPTDARRGGFPVGVPGVIPVASSGADPLPGVLQLPGSEVVSLTPNGHYDFFSGSSVAAAQVTGVLALLKSGDRSLRGEDALQILQSSAGASGVPNACRALGAVSARGACVPLAR